jgi:two-component system, NtrC family, response regulator AtoC
VEKRSILIVDDDELILNMLTGFFAQLAEYEVATAINGEDALSKYVPGRFDLVISDLMMPDMDGLTLLKELMAIDDKVLFILITGYPTLETAIDAIKNGAFDYVVKPFNLEDLKFKVERALLNKRLKTSLKKTSGMLWALLISVPIWLILGIVLGIIWKR